MPKTLESAIETAKDATYTVVGLNLLFLERIGERFEDQFSLLDSQLEIARSHARDYESKRAEKTSPKTEKASPKKAAAE